MTLRFLSIASRNSTAHDFNFIRARTRARVCTQIQRNFPQVKLNSEINARFLFNENGDLYRVHCKLLLLVHKALNDKALEYIKDLLCHKPNLRFSFRYNNNQ